MYKIYLKKDDLLSNKHDLVLLLFNEAANIDLIRFYSSLCNKSGGGFDSVVYLFWETLDDYDKFNTPKYDGLEISTEFDDELILSYDEVLYYMRLLAKKLYYKPDELNEYIVEFAKINNLE